MIVFEGDGAMQMNGLAELITIKHYWEQWADPRLIIAVLHNDDLNQVTWEMRAMEGAPKFTAVPDAARRGLRRVRQTASACRASGWTSQTRSAPRGTRPCPPDRPTLLDVRTDPNVPPIPPHATFEQAKDSAEAMLKGDEDRHGVIVEGVKEKVQEFLPHRGR